MPLKEEIVDVFLGPQAKSPVKGRSWGLRAVYNCSIVDDFAKFTVLTDKSKCENPVAEGSAGKKHVRLNMARNYIYASASLPVAKNIFGYMEIGKTGGKTTNTGYGDASTEKPWRALGLELTDVYEFLLWQAHTVESYLPGPNFNTKLDQIVRGVGQPLTQVANGSYVWNETFFEVQGVEGSSPKSIKSLLVDDSTAKSFAERTLFFSRPIGLQCQVASTLGTAELNTAKSTFRSFELSTLPLETNLSNYLATRLGRSAINDLTDRYIDIFASVNSPAPILTQNAVQYVSFIQPKMLHESVMLAFGREALQLMYDSQSGFEGSWEHPNLTSSTPGRVLVTGKVGPAAPAIILAIWSVSCTLLGLWYGFRRRRLEALNGFEFFRLGVQMAGRVKGQPGYLTAREFRQFKTLQSLPGSVKYL